VRDCREIAFQTDEIQIAVIVFVKVVEFAALFAGHEFHELTRMKFSRGQWSRAGEPEKE